MTASKRTPRSNASLTPKASPAWNREHDGITVPIAPPTGGVLVLELTRAQAEALVARLSYLLDEGTALARLDERVKRFGPGAMPQHLP